MLLLQKPMLSTKMNDEHGAYFICDLCMDFFDTKDEGDACCKNLIAKPMSNAGLLDTTRDMTPKQKEAQAIPTNLTLGSRDK